jgi:hypothetical protein
MAPDSTTVLTQSGAVPDSAPSVQDEAITTAAAAPALPTLIFPKPCLQSAPSSAAPGDTIQIFGCNLYPPGAYMWPKVRFGTSQAASTTGITVSATNTTVTVQVPHLSGSMKIWIDGVGGLSDQMGFTFRKPQLTSASPKTGGLNSEVLLSGSSFGVKPSLSTSSSVTFGNSPATVVSWNTNQIRVKAPSDFGTGLNSSLWGSGSVCLASFSPTSQILKFVVNKSVGCSKFIDDLVKKASLIKTYGGVQRSVPIIVRTSAGSSSSISYTYSVAVQ